MRTHRLDMRGDSGMSHQSIKEPVGVAPIQKYPSRASLRRDIEDKLQARRLICTRSPQTEDRGESVRSGLRVDPPSAYDLMHRTSYGVQPRHAVAS